MSGAELRRWRRAQRTRRGQAWTQKRAARWFGVSLTTWKRWEAWDPAAPKRWARPVPRWLALLIRRRRR